MATSNSEKKRILFVEDDVDLHELVRLMLTGYRLVTARNFADGLRLSRQWYFDLYILDNWLPDGNGVELCRLIREFDPHTPILFLSGAAYESDVREALTAGAQLYITKPCGPHELDRAVARLILAASAMAVEARLAAINAVREELAINSGKTAKKFEEGIGKRPPAEVKALRAKAMSAFLSAMGSRGDFARLWPSIYQREVRNRRNNRGSASTSGT